MLGPDGVEIVFFAFRVLLLNAHRARRMCDENAKHRRNAPPAVRNPGGRYDDKAVGGERGLEGGVEVGLLALHVCIVFNLEGKAHAMQSRWQPAFGRDFGREVRPDEPFKRQAHLWQGGAAGQLTRHEAKAVTQQRARVLLHIFKNAPHHRLHKRV
ncbi:hypothetical protein DQ04_07021030 [Trypanosoma grayi]|uniref:hypothetical protein n=1 Tax=Trypanosoma grayi TaxID=71804 RepID=UPI0004F48C3B|nr:hypothetical protein DQ04_07021030 [Trypanosoma grayi]KEG08508.1 hypothetical protein DQ04_07021030 [Trypanosoma grayi]